MGSTMRKVVLAGPCCEIDRAVMLDHDRFHGREAEPGPLVNCLVVKKSSNIWGCTSSGIPGPLSITSTVTSPSAADRPQCERPGPIHGIYRVGDEVRPYLIELATEGLDPGKFGIEVAARPRCGRDGPRG